MNRATAFRDLHRPGDPFTLINVWDAGGAKMAAAMGAEAVATSSAAHAFTLGRPDGAVSRDEALAHAEGIVAAVGLPVSGDFEDGFGLAPDEVAETVRLAAEIGLAGTSIEDIAQSGETIDFELSVERIRAASAAARALGHDFVLVARADGIMKGRYDCDAAIARLLAYQAAGADCVYAPMPRSMEDLKRICSAVDRPVNALAAGRFAATSRAGFAAAGVARISLGSSLARAVQTRMRDLLGEVLAGDFSAMNPPLGFAEIEGYLAAGAGAKHDAT